jgi:hypothetical protein
MLDLARLDARYLGQLSVGQHCVAHVINEPGIQT